MILQRVQLPFTTLQPFFLTDLQPFFVSFYTLNGLTCRKTVAPSINNCCSLLIDVLEVTCINRIKSNHVKLLSKISLPLALISSDVSVFSD